VGVRGIQSCSKLGYLGDGQVERPHGGDDFRHAIVLAEGLRGMHLLKKIEKDRDELPKSTRSV
jgi:hypothetical protein